MPSLLSSQRLIKKKPHYKSIAQPIRLYTQHMNVINIVADQEQRRSQKKLHKQTKKVIKQVIKNIKQKCESFQVTQSDATTVSQL